MAITRYEENIIENSDRPSSRAEVLARYRRLREISKQHHHEILKFVSGDQILNQARRLGLARGKTLFLEDIDEMNYVYDLAIHTALAPRRSRAIDRYAGTVQLESGSDEALVLDAMRAARFSILTIERRHEAAGLIATDMFHGTEIWLVDVGFESSAPDGAIMATRLFTPESFSMTAGITVPFDLEMVLDIQAKLPRRLGGNKLALIDAPRFAETVYRVALAGGLMDRVRYQEVPAA